SRGKGHGLPSVHVQCGRGDRGLAPVDARGARQHVVAPIRDAARIRRRHTAATRPEGRACVPRRRDPPMEPETPEPTALRSRRALPAAAAGSAAALAASAALPLAASAAPTAMSTEQDNPSTANTSVTDSGAGSTAFAGNAKGTGAGYGLLG